MSPFMDMSEKKTTRITAENTAANTISTARALSRGNVNAN
jgi:hypothetical protein